MKIEYGLLDMLIFTALAEQASPLDVQRLYSGIPAPEEIPPKR